MPTFYNQKNYTNRIKMVQANPASFQRRELWAIGLLNAALLESKEVADEVVAATLCEADDCQNCVAEKIPPRHSGCHAA